MGNNLHKKRFIILLALVVMVSLGLAVAFLLRPSLDYQTFQTELAKLELTQTGVHTFDPGQTSHPVVSLLQGTLAKLTGCLFVLGRLEASTSILLEQRDGEHMPIILRHSGKTITV